MTVSPNHRPQTFYTTPAAPCPYLPGRMERKVITDISGPDPQALHDRLSRAGFRRSHGIAYAPVCAGCSACLPIRVPVARFAPDRTQRRILRRNADLVADLAPAQATEEHFALFSRYQAARHAESDMAHMGMNEYRAMIEDTPIDTALFEFRDPAGTLRIVSLVDRLSDGLSAVYTFYDPDYPERSFGTYAILRQIAHTRAMGLAFLYLGYWVKGSAKMAYKSRFRPAEIMIAGGWRSLAEN